MSKLKDIYEDLQEYVEVINARIRDWDEIVENKQGYINPKYADGMKQAYKKVEEELERILDGKGL